jgi:DNA-binding MarR family transcriptional regulator
MARGKRRIADRLHSAAIHLLRRLREADAASGISPSRLSTLSVLVFGGPASMRELAEAEMVRSPTMTGIIQGLEDNGLVARAPDPHDGRAVVLRPTDRGARLFHAARARRIDAFETLLHAATPAELRVLDDAAEILDQLIRSARE